MDIKVSEVVNRIIDVVLEENIISKESLQKRIHPILSIWVRKRNLTKKSSNPKNINNQIRALEMQRVETQFWKHKCKDIVNDSEMNEFYSELDEYIKQWKLFGNQKLDVLLFMEELGK